MDRRKDAFVVPVTSIVGVQEAAGKRLRLSGAVEIAPTGMKLNYPKL
jgi:hypothetical protein